MDPGSKLCNVPLPSLNGIVGCHVLVCTVLRDGKGVLAVLGFGQDERSLARIGDPVVRVTWMEETE